MPPPVHAAAGEAAPALRERLTRRASASAGFVRRRAAQRLPASAPSGPDRSPSLKVRARRGGSRITVTGSLNIAIIRRLKEEVARLAAEESGAIVLDLTGVTFIDALGYGAILDAGSACAKLGQTLELVPPPTRAGSVLVLLVTPDRLRVRPRRADRLTAVRTRGGARALARRVRASFAQPSH